MEYGKNKWFKKLRNVYGKINENNFLIIILILGTVVTGILEYALRNCDFNESVTNRCFNVIGPIDFVIWTFTVSLVLFYLGKMEDKRYGIRIVDMMPSDLPFEKVIVLVITFLSQLIILLVVLLTGRVIMLVGCTINQVLMMTYVFIMVSVEISSTNVRDKIIERARRCIVRQEDEIDWTLSKLLIGVNYNDFQEVKEVEMLFNEITANESEERGVYNFAKEFAKHVIRTCKSKEIKAQVINRLLINTENIYTKRGVFTAALLCPECIDISSIIYTKFDAREKIFLWAIAYCIFYYQYENQKHLLFFAKLLKNVLQDNIETTELLNYWANILCWETRENDNKSRIDLQLNELRKIM